MNRSPKHAPPSATLKKTMNTLMLKFDRKTGKDCAYCRSSETRGKGFICTKGYAVMDAVTCDDFTDSRKPSKGAKE